MRNLTYRAKECEKCGKAYNPRSSTARWCDECLTKICECCGSRFSVGKKTRYATARYCSKACARKAVGERQRGKAHPLYKDGNRCEKVDVSCTVCGNVIMREKKQAQMWGIHFCGNECRGKYQSENRRGENNPRYARVEKACEWCGKLYEAWPCTQIDSRFCSKECRNDWQSDMMRGENHYNWKGGTSGRRQLDMSSREYKRWRGSVFERDLYTCQICGDSKGGNLNAHHIRPYKDFPELRHEVSNGVTLCKACHIQAHQITV